MSATEVVATADHWWWRPGWAPGRRFYTWHCTFVDQPAVCAQAEVYRAALAGVPGLDLVDDRWLHLTLQGLGFADEVTVADVDAIVAAARGRLAAVEPFDSWIDRPEVTAEAVRWELPGPFAGVRRAVRGAVAEIWDEVPEPEDGFAAHVSIAYSHAVRPAAPVRRHARAHRGGRPHRAGAGRAGVPLDAGGPGAARRGVRAGAG